MSSVYQNTNGFPMANGKNLHMDVGPGDLANRIITVGAASRLDKIATHFDEGSTRFRITSGRGMTSVTGTFKGVPVSVVAIGMGTAMMDFFVRETRAVVEGPVAMIRFGTCGGLTEDAVAGSMVVASKGSANIIRNVDGFAACYTNNDANNSASSGDFEDVSHSTGYTLSNVAPASTELSTHLSRNLTTLLNAPPHTTVIKEGINITADSFYSSQGRIDNNFHDCNAGLIQDYVCNRYPEAASMEMETFTLFHLALCAKKHCPIYAAAASIVVANRRSSEVLSGERLDFLEHQGGLAVLQALVDFKM